jgi:predicted transcriptional regulator
MPTVPFSLRIEPKLKAKLEKEAAREDRSAAYIAQRAIAAFIESREARRKALKEAVAEADKGVFISEEAMDAWVDSWGTENELPPPEPDIFPAKKKSA